MQFPALHRISVLIPLACPTLAAIVSGDPPAVPGWWSDGTPGIPMDEPVINANPANNHGPANIGQAKWMTKRALTALEATDPALAAEVAGNLVGPGNPIENWDPAVDQNDRDKQHAPLLIGQLKAIAAPFYEALHSAQADWLESQLVANGTKDSSDPGNYFPWSSTPEDDQNKSMATVGQLKAVFSLRFTDDGDANRLPDLWEILYFCHTGISTNGDQDGDGLTNSQELAFGSSPISPDTNGDGITDADEYSEAEVRPPLIWLHRFVYTGSNKASAFQQFTPTVPPVPPTPIISYYLKKTSTVLGESTTSSPSHTKQGSTSVTSLDSETFVAAPSFPSIDFDINEPPGYYPDFNNGVWQAVSQSASHLFTKATDDYSSSGSYSLPNSGTTGSASYSDVTTLSEEYTTDMLIAAGDAAFEKAALDEEKKPWSHGFPPVDISTYTTKDESSYKRTEVDYALEPPFSPDAPVRGAWLDVNRTDLGRGYQGGTPDPAATQSITLHEEYYSKAKARSFWRPLADVNLPRSGTRRVTADLNMRRLILPLSCSLDLNLNLGPLIVTHDANGQPIPIDWEDPDGGYLDVSFAHNHWTNYVQYGDVVADEFDVPVKLEAVEGGENIRLAEIITTNGLTTLWPVSLPIADVRDCWGGFVVHAISPGKVTLKASLTTKHGLQVSKRTQVENALPPVSLVVVSNGIGSMVPSVQQGRPDHFVTQKCPPNYPQTKSLSKRQPPA